MTAERYPVPVTALDMEQTLATKMAEDIRFDPTDRDFIRDPYPTMRQMRERDPVHFADDGYWVVTRHADIRALFKDKRFGQGDFIKNIQLFYDDDFDVLSHSAYRWLSKIFVMQDPPEHTRMRGLVTKALSAGRVEAMRPRIKAITDRLVDNMIANGRAELVHDFCYRMPTTVMCDMLGIRDDEVTDSLLQDLNQAIADSFIVFETRAFSSEELNRANRQIDYLTAYFDALFEDRRQRPRDDLTTALLQARDGDAKLTAEELSTIVIGLFGAGFETTAHMLGNGLMCMHRWPEQWRLLCDDPTLAAGAVQEALRFEPSLQATYRTALSDAEIAGVPIKTGQRVLTLLGAAGRDPNVYDDPDQFDIRRKIDRQLVAFGGGIHYCVGAQLARLEGQVAFETLAQRLPGMQLDLAGAQWREAFFFRGLERMEATFPSA